MSQKVKHVAVRPFDRVIRVIRVIMVIMVIWVIRVIIVNHYQYAFNSQKEKTNILAEMLKI